MCKLVLGDVGWAQFRRQQKSGLLYYFSCVIFLCCKPSQSCEQLNLSDVISRIKTATNVVINVELRAPRCRLSYEKPMLTAASL
jgi:hypothetical protein